MAQILCENLELGYEGRAVVRDLNFEVNRGDYLCVVGENGSGKSTLIKTLLGLKKPMGGEIRFGDGLEPDEIGYLPQQTIVQRDFPASVREIVLSGCLNRTGFRPFYTREEKKKAEGSLERLGIRMLEKRCYRELSGGQQQRVAIARAIAAKPPVVLADEPTGALDSHTSREVLGLLQDLHRQGHTVVLITHDNSIAVQAERIIRLEDGRVVYDGDAHAPDAVVQPGAQLSQPGREVRS